MKLFNKIIFITTVVFLFIYCSNNENKNNQSVFSYASSISNIKLDSIKIPPILLHENKIIATNDLLISMSVYQDTVFRVFKLPDLKYYGSFGIKGKGPNELLHPNISGFRNIKEGFLVTDMKKMRIVKLPETLVTPNAIVIKKEISIPGTFFPFNNVFILNDSIICGINRKHTKKKEIAYFNINSKKIGSFIDYPEIYPQAPLDALWHLYSKHIAISPNNKFIVLVYDNIPLVRIYNIQNKNLKDIFFKTDIKQKPVIFNPVSVKNIFDLYSYYENVIVTNKHFYALYEVCKYVKKNKNEFQNIPVTNKQIHIFDYEGNMIKKINMKSWMNIFTVTPDDKFMYFINPDKENFIYKAKIEL